MSALPKRNWSSDSPHVVGTRSTAVEKANAPGDAPWKLPIADRLKVKQVKEIPHTTLLHEINDVCFVRGNYPHGWPIHNTCPCCDSSRIRPFFDKYQFSHWNCRKCRLVFVNPYPPKEILQELYNGSYYTSVRRYIEQPKARNHPGDASMTCAFKYLQPMVKEIIRRRPIGSWLDVGGGIGTFLHAVRRLNPAYQTYLNEFNEESIAFAQEHYQIEVLNVEAEQLEKQGMSFDVISMVGVLEHTSHPREVVTALGRLLKPGGFLALNIPRFSPLNYLISRAACPAVVPPFHLTLFDRGNFHRALKCLDNFQRIKTWQAGPRSFCFTQFSEHGANYDLAIPKAESDHVVNLPPPILGNQHKLLGLLNELAVSYGQLLDRIDTRCFLNVLLQKTH